VLRFGSFSVKTKVLVVQALILSGLVVYFKVTLPRIEKARAAERLAAREQAIGNFFQDVTTEGGSDAAPARRIRVTPDVVEVQRRLGAPDQSMTDFAGAQHLTWFGAQQKLIASFNRGRLYALTLTDLERIT
jgi:hypothetical protein